MYFRTLYSPVAAGMFCASARQTPLATLPSNIAPARRIYIVCNASTGSLPNGRVKILDRINPRHAGADRIRLTLFIAEGSREKVGRIVAGRPYINTVVHPMAADDDSGVATDWLQDAGEFHIDASGKLPFPTHNSSGQLTLGEYLSTARNVKLLRVGSPAQAEDRSVEGGDIEDMPGGSVHIGDDLSDDMKEALPGLAGKGKLIEVPVSFSNVGHVDGSYQLIPAPAASSNGCGYALARNDFLDGVRIAMAFDLYGDSDPDGDRGDHPVTAREYRDAIAYFTGVEAADVKLTRACFRGLIPGFGFTRMPRANSNFMGLRIGDVYVYRAFEAQKAILRGVDLLKGQALRDGCATLRTVGLPGMRTFGFNREISEPFANVGEPRPVRISNLTAFTNLVVLDKAPLIPGAVVPRRLLVLHKADGFARIGAKFRGIIVVRLAEPGYADESIVFTSMDRAIPGDGAAHCKSAVLRY